MYENENKIGEEIYEGQELTTYELIQGGTSSEGFTVRRLYIKHKSGAKVVLTNDDENKFFHRIRTPPKDSTDYLLIFWNIRFCVVQSGSRQKTRLSNW